MDTLKQHEFVTLIQQYRNIVAQVCIKYCPNNMTPDELIDEVIAEAWESWPRFRGDSKFSTWLYGLARNMSIDKLRRFLAGPKIILVDPREFQMAPLRDESYAERELTSLREQRVGEIF